LLKDKIGKEAICGIFYLPEMSPQNMSLQNINRQNMSLQRCLLIAALAASFGLPGCMGNGRLLHPGDPIFSREAPAVFDVLLETSKGKIRMEVKREWAPHGADRFYHLVKSGYYNHAAVFRINRATWAQFGIAEDSRVSQAWRRQTIPDDPFKMSNARGTVAFAFKDPNGRTTQVFINLRDNSSTHDKEPFVPFARVTQGMEVADSLYDGYGERSGGGIRGGKQDSLFVEGNDYLRRHYPKLDYIQRATIIRAGDVNP
jgi:cyclophilin family peptidyl-prolyl cis-trans isomerase